MNSSIAFSLLPIISWHSCSYSCVESVGKGKAVFEMMSRYIPEFAEDRKRTLSRPIFFADKYEFAVLNDVSRRITSGGVEIAYDGLLPPHSLIDERHLALLKRNSSITQRGGSLKVGSTVLKPASSGGSRAPLLLPFGSREI